MTYNDTLPEHELLEEDPLIPEEGLPEEPDPDEFSAAGVADDDNLGSLQHTPTTWIGNEQVNRPIGGGA